MKARKWICLLLTFCLLVGPLEIALAFNNVYTDSNDGNGYAELITAQGNESNSWDKFVTEHSDYFDSIVYPDFEQDIQCIDMFISQNGPIEPNANTGNARIYASTSAIVTRYTVLLLDTSGSMRNTPITRAKQAAAKFVEQVLAAEGDNYVAFAEFNGVATLRSDFTQDANALMSIILNLPFVDERSTNQDAALQLADSLLQNVPDTAIRNIVLLSDGLPETGISTNNGPYTSYDYSYGYGYANSAYNTAQTLKNKYYIYTLGFFHSLSGSNLSFGRRFMADLQNAGYYDVVDPNDLEFVFSEISSSIVKKTGTFKYPGDGRDYSSTYYYDDAYFYDDSYTYNQHLATMSLCFALSAFGSEDVGESYPNKMINAQELLTDIGFIGFDSNYTDYSNYGINGKPTKDSIGSVVAHKPINDGGINYTLIALALRGGGYESEWASNFTIGSSGQHKGFSEARDQVISFLNSYIKEKDISGDNKLWVTGYSRAAATANMVAGAIDEKNASLFGCTLALSDLYAYTFETPAGTLKSMINNNVFKNIFNIINQSDPVTKVAPSTWSFARYGIDKILPSRETESEEQYYISQGNMQDKYYALENVPDYRIDGFGMRKINIDGWGYLLNGEAPVTIIYDTENQQSQNVFLNNYITMLAKDFLKNRSTYVANYQNEIRDICGIFFGASKSQSKTLIDAATDKISNNIGTIVWELLRPFGGENAAYGKIAEYLKESLDEAGITAYTQNEFDNTVKSLMDLLVAVALNHPNLAVTIAMNIDGIGQAHLPEVCLAWMQSWDSYYSPGGADGFTSGKYRIVRINCPVDINVYNASNTLVASIIDDVPQAISSIIATYTEEEEKLIYLPASSDYTVEIIATGDGMMNYSLNEYNPYAGEINRLVNYYDIPITIGQLFIGGVPAYNDADMDDMTETASSTTYSLSTDENDIPKNEDLSGESATAAYFMVNAVSEDASKGIVMGSGAKQLGTYAKVTVLPYDNSKFLGWYENGISLISEETAYRFRVENDIDLVAKFESDSTNASTGNGNGNSSGGSNNGGGSKGWSSSAVPIDNSSTATSQDNTLDPVIGENIIASEWSIPLSVPPRDLNFTDIDESYWAYMYIKSLADYYIIDGYPVDDGTFVFRPEERITRAEVIKLIVASLRLELKENFDGQKFSDWNNIEDWAKPYIGAAVNAEIVYGSAEGDKLYVNADNDITRQEIVAMIVRSLGEEGTDSYNAPIEISDFNDADDWAYDTLAFAIRNGMINTDSGIVRPLVPTTRAEAAMMLYKMLEYLM